MVKLKQENWSLGLPWATQKDPLSKNKSPLASSFCKMKIHSERDGKSEKGSGELTSSDPLKVFILEMDLLGPISSK